ncbi:MAG: NAD(P)-dependent glycerol-3-phosphate dehydrogenase [bacterium]|nr:NAD(P)-dependent glycerol-3-phosphate dehydrogenase [bacterium]
MMRKKVTVLGCGPWGMAIARLLAKNGHNVLVWCHSEDIAEHIVHKRKNPILPDIILPENIDATSKLEESIDGSDYLFIAVASHFIRIIEKIIPVYKGAPVITLTKGLLDDDNRLFISDYLKSLFGGARLAVLSGPNLAHEILLDLPAATVIASDDLKLAESFQLLLSNKSFRAYTADDIRGVELGGILKNIIAIAAGIVDGLSLGVNSKAALMSRSLQEIIRFGLFFGAQADTFYGLSGLGDLITTCNSSQSRNWNVGYQTAQKRDLNNTLTGKLAFAEGVRASRIVYRISEDKNIDMPITEQVYKVLFEKKLPLTAINDLMVRNLRQEL